MLLVIQINSTAWLLSPTAATPWAAVRKVEPPGPACPLSFRTPHAGTHPLLSPALTAFRHGPTHLSALHLHRHTWDRMEEAKPCLQMYTHVLCSHMSPSPVWSYILHQPIWHSQTSPAGRGSHVTPSPVPFTNICRPTQHWQPAHQNINTEALPAWFSPPTQRQQG